jgi:hypothetical protein
MLSRVGLGGGQSMSDTVVIARGAPAQEVGAEKRQAAVHGAFFLWMSVLLLSVVLIGFAPTFYLRPFFDNPIPIFAYNYVHGVVITAWYVWLVVQTAAARMGQAALHRRIGLIGVGIATLVVVAGPMAALGFAARPAILGIGWDVDVGTLPFLPWEGMTVGELISEFVWSSFFVVALFAGLVVAAIVFRRRPEVHKRLMLLASISIIGPALSRIFNWPPLPGEGSLLFFVTHWGLLATVIVRDFVTTRRPHSATLIAYAAFVLSSTGSRMLAHSAFGIAVVGVLE